MANQRRTYVVYEWKQGDTVLGYGVTDNLKRREAEHKKEEPSSKVHSVAREPNEGRARKCGISKLREYEKKHGDLPPKNKPR